jgi:hypothetical protein
MALTAQIEKAFAVWQQIKYACEPLLGGDGGKRIFESIFVAQKQNRRRSMNHK